jgi:hypothetical protein
LEQRSLEEEARGRHQADLMRQILSTLVLIAGRLEPANRREPTAAERVHVQ